MTSLFAFWIGGASGSVYVPPPVPESAHSIFRVDQDPGGGDMYRGTAGGSSDIFRAPPTTGGGKVYR